MASRDPTPHPVVDASETGCSDRFETVVNSISDGVFAVDRDWRITCFNSAAEKTIGISRERALGRPCREVFRANICEEACALRYTMETGRPIVNLPVHIRDARGSRVSVTVSTALLKDKEGRVVGGVETFRDLNLVKELLQQVAADHGREQIVTQNPTLLHILDIVPTIAESESTVLIGGESGTGKGLLAKAIHRLSTRSDGPLVTINCGALPEPLLESELFGYKAGAFTGANRDKPGRVAAAARGTLFLDEIGDLPVGIQVKLLRLLQDRLYEPLGEVRSREADVRIVAATHQDLGKLVEEGRFRQDLFYRVNVIRLEMPPLRERINDVPLLAESFLRRLSMARAKVVSSLSPQVMELLMAYRFPGNVRELENILEHAYVLAAAERIEVSDLPDWFRARVRGSHGDRPSAVEALETRLIREALDRSGGNRTAAARDLGMHKTTLHRKIRKLGIELPARDGRAANKGGGLRRG
ncbi:MAG: sigma 54-interacting transcriptional regulator [Acidobacteria bacterium]|jgi:PAS domain S-box-containing protein|nr:sigma 54-interacting transcriptional regulator [Acidobacteriota bacterium]